MPATLHKPRWSHRRDCMPDEGGELSLADAVAYARRGRGERQRPQIGWASLTPAERDIVRLIAAGHTNAAIGQRMFISVNTVKKHLSRVYANVDVDGSADPLHSLPAVTCSTPLTADSYPVG